MVEFNENGQRAYIQIHQYSIVSDSKCSDGLARADQVLLASSHSLTNLRTATKQNVKCKPTSSKSSKPNNNLIDEWPKA